MKNINTDPKILTSFQSLLIKLAKLGLHLTPSDPTRHLRIAYSYPHQAEIINTVRNSTDSIIMQADDEIYQIFKAVQETRKIGGDIAEVGVGHGGSAKVICMAKKERPLHLFDTFAGLPTLSSSDSTKQYRQGQLCFKLEEVQKELSNYPNIYYYKGIFPDTAKPVENKYFSFVHLDVDLYQSTIDTLEFFYPRVNSGGIIISHDYPISHGVKKAFDEFFTNKREIVIEPSTSQALIVKL